MPWTDILKWSAYILWYVVFSVVLLGFVLLRKRESSSALAWSLTIFFLPVVGPILFFLFGVNRVPRRLRRRIERRADFAARCDLPDAYPSHGRARHRENRWGSLGRLLEGLGETPRRDGNVAEIYRDGSEAAEAVTRAVANARHHVHVETYIFRRDRLGRRVIELLIDRIREGVEVRLIVDGLGSFAALSLLNEVRRAGGEAKAFLPLFHSGRVSPNLRNHRKIIICDGREAFFGGMNVGEEYLGRRGRWKRDWYDLHMRLAGPAVLDLQRVFAEDWHHCSRHVLDAVEYFPRAESHGDASVQVIAGGPDGDVNAVRQAFFGAFTRSRRRLFIASPYLVPDLALREALMAAARSGVDVRIVTQSAPPDNWIVWLCGRFYAEQLLEAGVRIFAFPHGMMHAKAVAVDGEWAMLGSANLDNRSTHLNFEQMCVFDDAVEARLVESELKALLERSEEWTLEMLHARTRREKVLSAAARLLAPIL